MYCNAGFASKQARPVDHLQALVLHPSTREPATVILYQVRGRGQRSEGRFNGTALYYVQGVTELTHFSVVIRVQRYRVQGVKGKHNLRCKIGSQS
jgi:hypothetical protein